MKYSKQVLFLILVFAFASCTSSIKETEKTKPNIIFIFADDQCYKTLNAYGNNEIKTPALDGMAKEGVTFTNAYNMGAWNGAVCQASRAMLNCGQFVWRAHQSQSNFNQWAAEGKMWGNLMKQAGYNTYMTGKWHVEVSPEKCFDQVAHMRPGMPRDHWSHDQMARDFIDLVATGKKTADELMPVGYNRPLSSEDKSWSPTDSAQGGFWEGGKHWSEVLRDDAVSFIEDATQKEDPFFMYLAFNAAHDPRQSPQEYIDMYPLEDIAVPESFQPLYPDKEKIGNGQDLRDEALAPFPRTEYAVKVNRQEYYAIISHMDEQIRQILDAIEKSGKKDNTYIFFTADHGLAVGHHGLIGKQNLYDHSIRPPMIVIGPDIPKNSRVNADVYLQDIMATSLELAGLPKPEYVEFSSFLDIAKGKQKESNYESIYGAYVDFQRMIRKDGMKLIVYPKIPKLLLFDLKVDPEEINNLADLPEYSAKVKSLFSELLALQKDMDDPLDIATIFPELIN